MIREGAERGSIIIGSKRRQRCNHKPSAMEATTTTSNSREGNIVSK